MSKYRSETQSIIEELLYKKYFVAIKDMTQIYLVIISQSSILKRLVKPLLDNIYVLA